jgi:hypothetical protein
MWIEAKPEEFKISDWLPLGEAFARVHESQGDRDPTFPELTQHYYDLAVGEMNRHLVHDRLKSAVVLIPETGPPRPFFLWSGYWRKIIRGNKHQHHLQAMLFAGRHDGEVEFRVAAGAAKGVDPYPAISKDSFWWEEIGASLISLRGRVFIRRAESDALYPPSKLEAKAKPRKGSAWASDIARQLRANGMIHEGTTQEELAEMIVQQMQEEAVADPSLRPLGISYVRTRLPEWKLWPINLI